MIVFMFFPVAIQIAMKSCFLMAQIVVSAGDASDTLFSVSASGSTAGRIALTGAVDREATNIFTISITVQ